MDSTREVMSRTFVMILAGGRGERLDPLTRDRAKPAVPFGGTFRILDFTLSNCLNSGLERVHVVTQYRSDSIEGHLAGLAPKLPAGARIRTLPPAAGGTYRGTADAVFKNIRELERSGCDRVLLLAGDHIYAMDYRSLIRGHVERGADVTVAAIEYPRADASRFGILEVDSRDRIVDFQEKPENPRPLPSNPAMVLANMGVYVFDTSVLMGALRRDAERRTSHEMGKDVLPELVRHARCLSHGFRGYWRDVGSLDSYHEASMDLLDGAAGFDPYGGAWPVIAQSEACPLRSARFRSLQAPRSSIVFPRSAIRGRVVRSVLSPGVQVDEGAEVIDSVLLPGVRVGRGARLRRAIVDQDTRVPAGAEIGYDPEADRMRFVVAAGGVVAVPAQARIAPAAEVGLPLEPALSLS